jgi:zinc protease
VLLVEPRWDPAEFERVKTAQLTRARQRQGDPEAIAGAVFERLLYGDSHPFATPVGGTVESVEPLTLADLERFWSANFSPSVAAIHVVGQVSREEVLAAVAPLAERWAPRPVSFPSTAAAPAPERPVVYFVDVPGAKQSVLRVGRLALPGGDPDYDELVWSQNRLGAGSSARLFQVLRVQKGYTYGASSGVPRRREVSPFYAQSSVRANVTLEALQIVRDELRGYRESYTRDDLETTQNLLIKQSAQRFETASDLLDVLDAISRFDLPLDHVEREQRELRALTLAAAHATLERYLDEERMIYLVVGDGATQRERLEQLGYGSPVMLDVHGNHLGG